MAKYVLAQWTKTNNDQTVKTTGQPNVSYYRAQYINETETGMKQ